MTSQKVDLGTSDGMNRLAAMYRYAQVGRCVNGVAGRGERPVGQDVGGPLREWGGP